MSSIWQLSYWKPQYDCRTLGLYRSLCQGKDDKTRLPERIGGDAEVRLLFEGNIKKNSVRVASNTIVRRKQKTRNEPVAASADYFIDTVS